MMQRSHKTLFLLWLTAGVGTMMGTTTEVMEKQVVKNLTNKLLQLIPYNDNNDNITTLVADGNLITLNVTDQRALASYPTLEELHLDSNRIMTVPAKYFSGLKHLRVLSLARNNISRLDHEAFSELVFLKELDLSHNELTNLPTQLLTGLTNLQILNLQDNPWNCSCPLQNTLISMRSAFITFGGPQVICASPDERRGSNLLEDTALCPTSPRTEPRTPTSVCRQQPQSLTITLKTTRSSSQNNSESTDQSPMLGNTWKFTACVAALALITSMLIVSAVKGPSWYKRFHNYRHRRLYHEEDWDGEDFVSTAFQQTEGHLTHETVTFEVQHWQTKEEEEEDGYFEDSYIQQEEEQEGKEIQVGP
ncbi:leucine-rich repeat-containing protein 19-like isoform X2 [Melanotaenia boesemani]|nr:leucine-rich repeat-containing protein 19-like isoform X2 [Melanotaenia boesemani]XP_041823566.1 leucine-rich repeat-containing protein 19-like isoform X2 [Melanotaenia boesemani]